MTTRRTLMVALLTMGLATTGYSTLLSAHGPTRQKVTETIEISVPAKEVWAAINQFENAASWLPMVESSEGEGGNEPGATRVLTLGPDVKIYETLKRYQPEKMSYSYRIPDKTHDVNILPVTNYSSTLSVEDNGSGSTVIWKGAFYRGYPNNDPPEELNDETAVAAVTGVYKAGLANLKKLLESQ